MSGSKKRRKRDAAQEPTMGEVVEYLETVAPRSLIINGYRMTYVGTYNFDGEEEPRP